MAKETTLWDLACRILRNHVEPGDTCEETINRLWTKGVAELRPLIWRGSVDTYFEYWNLERLSALIDNGDVLSESGHQEGDPPIVVRWRGHDYRLVGRRPIGQPGGQHDKGTHAVLILDIGNVAGDI